MVRTRGLDRTLCRVIGRTLGREDHHHSNDVLQRRRPTASACGQREVAPVIEDDLVMTEDVHAHTKEVVNDVEGFPGGPYNPSVLTDYSDHVVA
ncbi:hypothetical protein HKD37_02G005698 [Glycine soja]